MPSSDTKLLTELAWENLAAGAEYGPYPYTATERSLELWSEVYDRPAPASHIVPPGMGPIYVLHALRAAFNGIPAGGVLARQTFRFAAPAVVGEQILTTVRVDDKYERRERPYVVLGFYLRRPDGTLVAEIRKTLIWPRRDGSIGGGGGG